MTSRLGFGGTKGSGYAHNFINGCSGQWMHRRIEYLLTTINR